MARLILFLAVFVCSLAPVLGQTDTVRMFFSDSTNPKASNTGLQFDTAAQPTTSFKADTGKKIPYWGKPQKAALYSAILPGAGQVYNRQIYKVPIIYTGFAVLGYFLVSHNRNYKKCNRAIDVIAINDTLNPYPQYSLTQIIQVRDFYRRNRDYTIILSTVLYLLQIAEAHVFAHLKGFNVDDNLAIEPTLLPGIAGNTTVLGSPGISFTLTLR